MIGALENHLKQVPEDARARILLGGELRRYWDASDDALRELNLAVTLRANEASILYNAACVYCGLKRKPEALDALRKAWEAGFRDAVWARRDPDLTLLHGDPEFDRLYPEKSGVTVRIRFALVRKGQISLASKTHTSFFSQYATGSREKTRPAWYPVVPNSNL